MLQKYPSLLILREVRVSALTNTPAVFGALRELTNHTQGASPRGTSLPGGWACAKPRADERCCRVDMVRALRGARRGCAAELCGD